MTITRTAVVTGAAQGMGKGIIEALRKSGHTVHGVDREDADLSQPESAKAYFEKIGRVDILVNCAGGVVGQTHKPLEEITDDAWKQIFDANLQTTFLSTRAVVKGMKENGWGRIVNISSGAGRSVRVSPEFKLTQQQKLHRLVLHVRWRTNLANTELLLTASLLDLFSLTLRPLSSGRAMAPRVKRSSRWVLLHVALARPKISPMV